MALKDNISELDLHYTSGDPDLGIAQEGICCRDISEIVERISRVKNTVKKINLYNQRALTEIPAVLNECKHLEDLNISHTNIKEIPDFLFAMPALRSLSCCCSEIPYFPRGISRAEKLEYLHIRINDGWVLTDDISSLKNLKTLNIDLYSDAELPRSLGVLSNLEDLSLAIKFNSSTVPLLPDSFSDHQMLKKISISDPFYKNIKSFDLDHTIKILSSCLNLETFKLSGMEVGKGHQNLSQLRNIKDLELRHLSADGNIFESIEGLHNLEKLCILGSVFKITKIPDIFMNMDKLKVFSFAGNMILDLPPSIYSLANLSTLEICSTGISILDEKIANMRNLEIIHIYDNILEKLPGSILTLPKLRILNIEENIFNEKYIAAIKEKLNALAHKGRKIELLYERQGHRQMVKKLRAIKDLSSMNINTYSGYCMNAVNENPYALKYINKSKIQSGPLYANLCMTAVRKTCFALENIDTNLLTKPVYFKICTEAAKSPDIGNSFKYIKDNFLTDNEYIQVCLVAALHNKSADFISNFNNDSFQKRFDRIIYERICWAAVLHHPPAISKMINPTDEIKALIKT